MYYEMGSIETTSTDTKAVISGCGIDNSDNLIVGMMAYDNIATLPAAPEIQISNLIFQASVIGQGSDYKCAGIFLDPLSIFDLYVITQYKVTGTTKFFAIQ